MEVHIAHSPDADDYFLFWGLRNQLLDSQGFTFTFTELDTEDLNQAARTVKYDVCAISVATYPAVMHNYHLLRSGASIGRNYGPVIISKQNLTVQDLDRAIVGVPGFGTTAALLLKKIAPNAHTVEIPLTPYEAVFNALDTGKIQAAVVIHEGQIAYQSKGYQLVENLGRWWFDSFQLPLPVGVNVIRKNLEPTILRKLSALLQDSVAYSLKNRESLLPGLFEISQARSGKLKTRDELRTYLNMYANEDSLELRPDALKALEELLGFKDKISPL